VTTSTAGIGSGLAYAALSNACAMGMLLARLPYTRGPSCGLDTIVARLVDSPANRTAS
jgi:hypothetical protein